MSVQGSIMKELAVYDAKTRRSESLVKLQCLKVAASFAAPDSLRAGTTLPDPLA